MKNFCLLFCLIPFLTSCFSSSKVSKGPLEDKKSFTRYGLTFVSTDDGNKSKVNAPRFRVESKLWIKDLVTNETVAFYDVGSHRGEDTFVKENLFRKPAFDASFIFGSDGSSIILRKNLSDQGIGAIEKQSVFKPNELWRGVRVLLAPTVSKAALLKDFNSIRKALNEGHVLLGRTHYKSKHYEVMAEYPVNIINIDSMKQRFQVDTGYILYAEISSKRTHPAHTLRKAYIAFNQLEGAEIAFDKITSFENEPSIEKLPSAQNELYSLK